MNSELKREVRLPYGFTATFIYGHGGYKVEWSPNIPVIKTPRARRRFIEAYQKARDEFVEIIATVVGGRIATLDVGTQGVEKMTVSEPATKQ